MNRGTAGDGGLRRSFRMVGVEWWGGWMGIGKFTGVAYFHFEG